MLTLAGIFAADVAWRYVDIKTRTDEATRRLSELPLPKPDGHQSPTYHPRDIERETAFARGVITKISLPWNELFKALSATRVEEVHLLSVEPDAQTRTVRITGEARDIPAMLTYVARLESQEYFKSVNLVQHEVKREGTPPGATVRGASPHASRAPGPPLLSGAVSFVVGASWKQK